MTRSYLELARTFDTKKVGPASNKNSRSCDKSDKSDKSGGGNGLLSHRSHMSQEETNAVGACGHALEEQKPPRMYECMACAVETFRAVVPLAIVEEMRSQRGELETATRETNSVLAHELWGDDAA